MTIDSLKFDFHQLIGFKSIKGSLNKNEEFYGLSFILSDSLANALKKAHNIKIGMLNRKSHVRKVWDLNNKLTNKIVNSYDCFEDYYLPIDNKLHKQQIIAEKEYEKNLKSYEKNFRKSKWFDSKEKVKSTQNTEPELEDKNSLVYKVRLDNSDFLAFYYFNENRLYQGVYTFQGKYINENHFYSKYNELKDLLTIKYGEPKKVRKFRNKDLFDGASEIGMAIQTGEYSEYTLWETKNSTISLLIKGENFDSQIIIRYKTKNKNLLNEVKKVQRKEQLKGF